MQEITEHITKRLSIVNNHWETDPFPHIIIDNFLPKNLFDKISLTITKNNNNFKDVHQIYNTNLEYGKKTFGDASLNEYLKIPIEIMGGIYVKNFIEKIIGDIQLISLSDFKNYGGYSPFHIMKKGGFLGSHLDHSRSKNNDLHVANSIFYASPKWKKNSGGETILFNKNGLKVKKLISPIPNRLIIFLHTAESFHGVNTISKKSEFNRYSYYMDYYIKEEKLIEKKFNPKIKNFNFCYCDHGTTFLPMFPLGINSFKLSSLVKSKTYYPYLYVYLKYLFNINFNKIKLG